MTLVERHNHVLLPVTMQTSGLDLGTRETMETFGHGPIT